LRRGDEAGELHQGLRSPSFRGRSFIEATPMKGKGTSPTGSPSFRGRSFIEAHRSLPGVVPTVLGHRPFEDGLSLRRFARHRQWAGRDGHRPFEDGLSLRLGKIGIGNGFRNPSPSFRGRSFIEACAYSPSHSGHSQGHRPFEDGLSLRHKRNRPRQKPTKVTVLSRTVFH